MLREIPDTLYQIPTGGTNITQFSGRVVYKLRSDKDLQQILRAIEYLFYRVFLEEGSYEVFIDIPTFPPKQIVPFDQKLVLTRLPNYADANDPTLYSHPALSYEQGKVLSPIFERDGERFLLLAQLGGDADQAGSLFQDALRVNQDFKIISGSFTYDDDKYRYWPDVLLYSIRRSLAVIEFVHLFLPSDLERWEKRFSGTPEQTIEEVRGKFRQFLIN